MTRKRILVVEDENIVALDMKMRLESLGYEVAAVEDTGKGALDRMLSIPLDLVLMDIKLKGEPDGIETARIAREQIEVPIIFVTAFTDEKILERAKYASPYGYIVKPYHDRELRIAIELALYKFQYEVSMRRAKELAEETNRLKGEFLANVSHELKTPLNSVIGFTELARDMASDEEQLDYLDSALRSAKSLVGLINSILDFARMEGGKMDLSVHAFSLDALLGECVELLAVGAHPKGLDVTLRRDPAIPDILRGDEGLIKQVLINLTENAIKFTDQGFIRVSVSREEPKPKDAPLSPDSISIRFAVEDSGIGMQPERIASAFERFTQLNGSRTRSAGGTGLGLAIVHKSVELLGGEISVRSTCGEGSCFDVLVPLCTEKPIMESDMRKPPPLRKIKLAVVGFSGVQASDLTELLLSLGATPTFFQTLSEARATSADFYLADENAIPAEPSIIAEFSGRLVAAMRFGSPRRSGFLAQGVALLSLPVRASSLQDAIASLAVGRAASLPPRPGLGDAGSFARLPSGSAERRESEAPDREATFPGTDCGPEFRQFITLLEESLGVPNLAKAERDSKEHRELFRSRGKKACERVAFSALLLARKGDLAGLQCLAEKAKQGFSCNP